MNTSEIIPLVRAFSKAPTDAQVTTAVDAWLDDHPEATTTVEDGSITKAKLDSTLQEVVDEVPILKDGMDTLLPVNLFNGTLIDGSVNATTGDNGSSTTLKRTGFISVDGLSEIIYKRIYTTASSATWGMAFYTSNNKSTFISGSGQKPSLNNAVYHWEYEKVTVPDEAKYVRFTWSPSQGDFAVFDAVNYESVLTTKYENEIAELQSEVTELKRPVYNIRSAEHCAVISNMQSGHGFTNPFGSGSEPTDDTVDYIFGTQSVQFQYAGQALVSADGIDLQDKIIEVLLKVDIIGDGNEVRLYLSDSSSFSSYRSYILFEKEPSDQFEVGTWSTVSISTKGGSVVGTPNMAAIKYIRFTGSASSMVYHVQSVGYRESGIQKPCISFTFDDGWAEALDGAKILGKYGIPATAYVYKTSDNSKLTVEQLKSLKWNYGWDIEMHGLNVFTTMSESDLVDELTELKNFIVSNGLGRGDHLAYPGGKNNRDVVNIVSRFCKTARTISHNSSNVETIPSPMQFNLRAVSSIGASGTAVSAVKQYIDQAVARKGWLILVFHRIGDTETTMFCSASDLEAIADYAVKSGADIKTVADMWERN